MAFFREHQQVIMRIGGVLLVMVGLMLLTGAWDWLTSLLRQWAASFETAI
jgi:cytochrome c-type biogenesis protein